MTDPSKVAVYTLATLDLPASSDPFYWVKFDRNGYVIPCDADDPDRAGTVEGVDPRKVMPESPPARRWRRK